MKEIGISNKIKYTLILSILFLAVVLTTIFINMRKTAVESQKETSILNLLKNIDDIHVSTEALENNKSNFVNSGEEISLTAYQTSSIKLRQYNTRLLQSSIENNFERKNIYELSNLINKKILNTNTVVDIKKYQESSLQNLPYYDSIGNNLLKEIFTLGTKVEKKGIDLLQKSAEERASYTRYLTWLFVTLGVLFLISIVFIYSYIKKDVAVSEKLHKILSHNSTLLNNISDAIVTTNDEWIITDWNTHAEALYGYTKEEVKGKNVMELFKHENETGETLTEENKISAKNNLNGEMIHYHKNGTPVNVDITNTIIKNNSGNITGSISVIRDITDRVLLQQKLKELSDNLQQQVNVKAAELNFFFERIADAFIALDNDWNYTYLNKAALALHNATEESIIGKNIWERYPDVVSEPFYTALMLAKKTQQPQRCELYYSKDDKWFIDLIYPANDGISVYYHDITEKKKAELELKKAHTKLNFYINNTPLAAMEFDSEMNILQWSKRAEELFGWTAEEVIGTGFKMMDSVHLDDQQIVEEAIFAARNSDSANNTVKNRNYTKDRKVIYCEWYNSIIRDEKNNIIGMHCIVKDDTQSMLTQLDLINAEAKFRGIVEQTMVGVYIRKEHQLLYINPRFAEIFGYRDEELYGKLSLVDLMAEEDKHKVVESMNSYKLQEISSHNYQFKGVHKTGKIIYGEVYGSLTKYNGEDAVIGTIIDITERKMASEQLRVSDEALKFSNERFELVAKATNDGVWDWNIDEDILKGNKSFCDLLNIPENAEINYAYFNEAVHPDDRERLLTNYKKAITENISVLTEEFRIINKEGNYKTIFDRAYILYKNNKAYRMLGAMQDISSAKEDAQKLVLEKELSDSIINSLPGIFYLFTKEGKYKRWNKNFELVTGYNVEEIKEIHPLDLFMTHEKGIIQSKIENVFANGSDIVEANFKTKSGKLIPYYFTGMYIKYENEDCLMGVGMDISEKVNSQKELVESEQKFRTLVQQASDGIIITDEEGNFKEVNESAALLLGYSLDELNEMTTHDIFFEEGGIQRPLKFNSMVNGAVVISEHIIRRKGGKFINVEISAKQLTDGRYQRIIRDITERTQVEEALRISEKKYRLLFNENPLPMWISSYSKNTFLDVNSAAFLSYGYTKNEFLQMKMEDLLLTDHEHLTTGTSLDSSLNLAQQDILLHKKKNGDIIKVNLIQHDIVYEGKPAILTLANDVTATVDAEENLQRSNEALRDLASHLETIRENERSHMAREIHDELGQQLTGLKMDISWLYKKIKSDDDAINEKMTDTIKLIDKTVITVRRIATQLRPSILDDLGLIAAMEWQSEEFEKRSEITSQFTTNVTQVFLNADVATAIFRIFQESLTNVLRHSQATKVNSFFRLNDDSITLLIEDNGIGFNEEKILSKKTLGLLGMKERINLINGSYEINGNPGKGTSVIITVPLK